MLIDCVNTYLSVRRAVGFKLDTTELYLRSFANFATIRGDLYVVGQTAIDWAGQACPDDSRARRLDELIRFARFIRTEDDRHEIPLGHIFCHQRRRRTPYLFTDHEVSLILREANKLGPAGSLRPHTYRTIFGLLASTGMRISEVLNLRLQDITPDGLAICQSKFKKNRLVPLHATTVIALNSYLERRNQFMSSDLHVFISHRGGGKLRYDIVASTFQEILVAAGIAGQPGQLRPRLHDFRHRFAIKSLISSPDSRDLITRHMLALSTYLGHARMESTYWYLESTPELMMDIVNSCEYFIQGEGS
jgi:integrase